jgi:hypothetical protein
VDAAKDLMILLSTALTTITAPNRREAMATNDKTIDRLQYLEALYRQGYRSDTIDRSLDKIIAQERAAARREYANLRERLQAFETRYQMFSEDFYQRFRAGEMGDAMDVVEWSVFYEMWESVRARLALLEAA